MDFFIITAAAFLQVISVITALIMIKKTGHSLVWIIISLAITLKITGNFFVNKNNGFVIISEGSGLLIKIIPLFVSILLLLSIFWLSSLFKSLQISNKKLTGTNRHMEAILSGMGNPLMEIGRDYRIKSVNSQFTNIYSSKGQIIVGEFCYKVTHGQTTPCSDNNYPCPFIEIFGKGKSSGFEHIHKDPEGNDIIVELSCFPHLDETGNVSSMIEIVHDISRQKETEEKLSIFSKAVEQSPSVVVITDKEGTIEYVNPMFTQITEYPAQEVIGNNPGILRSGDTPDEVYKNLWETISRGGIWYGQFHNKKKNGGFYWESAAITSIKNDKGKITHYLAVKKDITREKEAQLALEKSEAHLYDAQKTAHIGSWETDVLNNTSLWSDENYAIMGLDPANTKASREEFLTVVHPDDLESVDKALLDSINNRSEFSRNFRLLLKDGTLKYVRTSARHYYNKEGIHIYTTGIMQDISDMVAAGNIVKKSLKEKEVLLKELYHRTKNNMQVITGLFRLRSQETDNAEVQQMFNEIENRIQSMSLVHEKLYQSKNLSSINLREYFKDLVDYMKDSYNLQKSKIVITMDIDNVSVLIDTATPLGLVFNELISNTMKHAFPGNMNGKINISLKQTETKKIVLTVSDNGVGFKKGYNFRKSSSLGIQTILALGEGQLRGKVSMVSKDGLTVKIKFMDNIYKARI